MMLAPPSEPLLVATPIQQHPLGDQDGEEDEDEERVFVLDDLDDLDDGEFMISETKAPPSPKQKQQQQQHLQTENKLINKSSPFPQPNEFYLYTPLGKLDKCMQCKMSFTTSHMLAHHIAKFHPKVPKHPKPFPKTKQRSTPSNTTTTTTPTPISILPSAEFEGPSATPVKRSRGRPPRNPGSLTNLEDGEPKRRKVTNTDKNPNTNISNNNNNLSTNNNGNSNYNENNNNFNSNLFTTTPTTPSFNNGITGIYTSKDLKPFSANFTHSISYPKLSYQNGAEPTASTIINNNNANAMPSPPTTNNITTSPNSNNTNTNINNNNSSNSTSITKSGTAPKLNLESLAQKIENLSMLRKVADQGLISEEQYKQKQEEFLQSVSFL